MPQNSNNLPENRNSLRLLLSKPNCFEALLVKGYHTKKSPFIGDFFILGIKEHEVFKLKKLE